MDMNKIGQMSCNPAVGGIAKGQIVREIDALGGQMGLVTDETAIQFRILNRSKGPAMWSPRAQCDRAKFIWSWREKLENTPNLHIWQDTVCELLVENGEVVGLVTLWGVTFKAKCIVLTAGTFLNGLMHVGRHQLPGGRMAEPASYQLTESIARHGIAYGRMKTGTPVRIDARSIHFDLMDTQDGECDFHKFSFMNTSTRHLKQLQCWTCYTNEEVHRILREGLPDSPLFNGQIQSIGPRYCPSIETKIVTFPDKEQHQLFLEPEGETTQELYLNGFSSSLPMDIQIAALKKVPAFKDIVIYRPGYAIEYDYFDPTQLKHSLESKIIKNLFFAGQVNGTTGYEEAGGQGLIAGINAHINCHGGEGFNAGGRGLLMFLVFLTEINDIMQFVWGKLFGRHKILPKVSPNKTWEGFLGGVVSTTVIGYFLGFLTPLSTPNVILVSALIAIAGFAGDVVISAIKRDKGIKDMGDSIPGHGGVFDRIDSLSYTAPVFFHLVYYIAY